MNAEFIENLKQGAKLSCPCCGRYAQVYRRKIHTSVALQLLRLYQLDGDSDYIHVSDLIPDNSAGAGDFTKAKYFGLILEKDDHSKKTKTSGYWKLTELGVDFVQGRASIPSYVLVYNDTVIGQSDTYTFIDTCKADAFDYREVMAGNELS